ncbi:olfactory receptor 10AG1-like [Echinops telfairi]|uniref:Olfactory receptor 10AG1-like n=1 Tax=Echinops telfairi TaxID=9371 RepID=A0AC55D5L6_ECHTE|nr:olfactory receptor 10AG1-like [Echinops telfairi]
MNYHDKPPEENLTEFIEFVLLGFADLPHLQWYLFGLFLTIYIIILMSNGTIFLITKLDPALQSPMYFFLANFSFLEMCYVSVTLPRMLMDLGTQRRRIPLVPGLPLIQGVTYQIFSLPFCGSKEINHFFCEIPPLVKLACVHTFINDMLLYLVAVLFGIVPFLLILGSYSKIISTILKLPSAASRSKAFSTCSSHVMVVVLFFGSAIIAYLRPKSSHSEETGKVLSLFYTILTPMFNPIIYSLRNKDVIMALRKLLYK